MGRSVRRRAAGLTALALAGVSLAAPQRYEMKSYLVANGKTQEAFAWCDAPTQVLTLTMPLENLGAMIFTSPKSGNGAGKMYGLPVNVGQADPGAGQIFYPLTLHKRSDRQSFIHVSNVENVNDPAYRMTRVNEFRLDSQSYRCRYVPQAVFMGATSKQTVIVWDNGKTATYATRNFDGTPGVYVTGGRKINVAGTGIVYDFLGAHGSTYRVITGSTPGTSAMLNTTPREALKGLNQSFLAYSVSQPVKARP